MIFINKIQNEFNMTRAEYAKYQSKTAHKMLFSLLNEFYGVCADESMIIRGEHGKPYIKGYEDIFFNISHCDRAIAVAFGECQLGIDVECIDRPATQSLAKRICSRDEYECLINSNDFITDFYKIWTLKESYIKAIGRGLSFSLKDVNFSIVGEKITCNQKNYLFSQHLFKDFVISVCYNISDNRAMDGGFKLYELR